MPWTRLWIGMFVLLGLAGCGGGRGTGGLGGSRSGMQTFTVGGSVTGLSGSGLVLGNNAERLTVTRNGTFNFPTSLANGASYNVTVAAQPSSPVQTCTVSNGTGTLSSNVSNVTITCVTSAFTVGGTVTGLYGSGLVLMNDAERLNVNAGGTFTFPTAVASGSAYNVTVATQPDTPPHGCVVSSGNGTVSNGPVDSIAVVCTRLALSLAGSTPVAGATNVARAGELTLSLSATLNTATVNTNTVTLSNAIAGAHPIVVAASGSQITVTPQGQLLPGTTYTIAVDTAVRGTGREGSSAPLALSFTTREGSWQTAKAIESSTEQCFSPRVAAGGDTILAVWEEGLKPAFNRYVPGQGWIGAGLVVQASAYLPNVAVDSRGVGHVIWGHATPMAARYTVSDGFSAAEPVDTDNAAAMLDPQLAVDARGNVFAVWKYAIAPDSRLWSNRYIPGRGWGTAQPLDAGSGAVSAARIGVDAQGNAIATWDRRDGARRRASAGRYDVASGWGTPLQLNDDDPEANSFDTRIAMSSNGDAMASYQFYKAGESRLMAIRYTPADGWGTPISIRSMPDFVESPEIAMDAAGNALAIWVQSGNPKQVWANRYIAGTGWGTAHHVSDGGTITSQVQVSMDKAGNALVVWVQSNGATDLVDNIRAIRYLVATGWGAAQSIDRDSATDQVTEPQLAFDGAGNAVAVWNSSEDLLNSVDANRFE